MIGKLAGLATIGSSFANTTLLQRFLSGMAGVIALTVLSSIMGGILVVCAFFGIYAGLVQYGAGPHMALMTVGILALALTVLLGGLAFQRLQRLRELPHHTLQREIPALSRVSGIVQAFIEGLTERRGV